VNNIVPSGVNARSHGECRPEITTVRSSCGVTGEDGGGGVGGVGGVGGGGVGGVGGGVVGG
jgi:hypothetical protein